MLLFLLVFIIALILYIHIIFQWKITNEIDIPHIELPDKDTLERVADTHQPFIFEKLLDSSVYFNGVETNINIQKPGETAMSVPHKALLSAIKKEKYLSDENNRFIGEANWIHDIGLLNTCDKLLKPHLNMTSNYDVIYGNHGAHTNLRTSSNGRNYFAVVEGNVEIKICTPRSGDYVTDKVNVWEPSEEDKNSLKECDVILILLQKGSIIHIPPFWWYSIRFPDLGCVLSFSYSTYMNSLAQGSLQAIDYCKSKLI